MGTATRTLTEEQALAILRERVNKTMRRQEAHATRMRAKRAEQAEKKKAIIEKGDDVVLCLDCRHGSPEIHSADLVIEQKPRHPIVERRDARATGRLVLDPRPDTWTRFGSATPTEELPNNSASFSAQPGDRGTLPVWLNEPDGEDLEGAVERMPFHQGDAPGSVRIKSADREAFIDPRYVGMEDGRDRTFGWSY